MHDAQQSVLDPPIATLHANQLEIHVGEIDGDRTCKLGLLSCSDEGDDGFDVRFAVLYDRICGDRISRSLSQQLSRKVPGFDRRSNWEHVREIGSKTN